jgi:two-component system, LytTR family, response regulator
MVWVPVVWVLDRTNASRLRTTPSAPPPSFLRMPTALIVDDEPLARTLMGAQLLAHPDIEVVGGVGSVAAAQAFVRHTPPDLVFLDLDMPGRFGLELIADLAATTRVIIVTASEEHALAAFDFGATDYLVKPVDPARLEATLERIALFTPRDGTATAAAAPLDLNNATLAPIPHVVAAGQIEMIPPADILWIESEQNYTQVHSRQPDHRSLIRQTLTAWEENLPAGLFQRISRSMIIRPAHIKTLSWSGRDDTRVTFKDSHKELLLGRAAAIRLKALLKG